MINDKELASELISQRKAAGIDRYDEVWEGVYMMSPIANNEHQSLATELSIAIGTVIDWKELGRTLAGANVSDRREDWTQNYRIPDVLVFLNETAAQDCGPHWLGGPDFAVEIVSPGDRTLEKLDFYAAVGTRELLVIDRDPWQLTLYRISNDKKLVPVAVCSNSQRVSITSEVLHICLQLQFDPPCIRLTHADHRPIRDIPIQRS
jgi:Uma2 family endonuclease